LVTLKLSFKPNFGNRKILIHIRTVQLLDSWKRFKLIPVKPHQLARLAQIKMDPPIVSADRKFLEHLYTTRTLSVRQSAYGDCFEPEFPGSVILQILSQHRHICRYARAHFTFP
jgi:hypothetical protein